MQGPFKNWKTTLAGILGGVGQAAIVAHDIGLHAGHMGHGDVIGFAGAAATALLGILAKDYNVTGGSVPQTPEAVERAEPIKE